MRDAARSGWGRGDWAIAGAAAAALVFSLYLAAQTRTGVFYSGDAGLKFLMTARLASAEPGFDLHLSAPPWVRQLWARGLFPFEPPFVYDLDGRVFAQYPPWFALASVPGYVVAGFPGLYALPLLGLWGTWAALVAACRGLGIRDGWTAAALLALALSSPLTLYGAMFWEHTAGVSLAFAGFTLLFARRQPPGAARASVAGALLAIAAWFRPELVVLAGIAVVLVWTVIRSRWALRCRLATTVAMGAFVLAAVVLNLLVYGRPGGLHALSAFAAPSLGDYLSGATVILSRLGELLLAHFPLLIPIVLVAVFAFRRRLAELHPCASIWFWSGLAFSVLVPLVVPGPRLSGHGGKQWGPRYLLAAMPILLVAGAAALQATWSAIGRRERAFVAALTVGAFGYGVFSNAYEGSADLRWDYAGRVLPALQAVRASPLEVVAVSNQFVSQELAAAMGAKSFLLARNGDELEAVGVAALAAGVHRFLFVSDANLTLEGVRSIRDPARHARIAISLYGVYGDYAVHEVRLEEEM